jgi:hypothetical protein
MRTTGGLDADVAVKVLKSDVAPDGQSVERLRDEAMLLSRLDHPAILRVHDLTEIAGQVALVAEYVDGQDLGEWLEDREASIPPSVLLDVVAEAASGLHAAWTTPGRDGQPLRIVHRDIKPANLRVSRHGLVKILDFGIARTDALTREARTATDVMIGSLPYMAPERFDDDPGATGPSSDVFALGCVLYEGLAGRRLYGGLDVPQRFGLAMIGERHQAHLERALGAIPEALPAAVRALCAASLAHRPEDRPSAAELASRCEQLRSLVGGPTLREWCRSRVWPAAPAVAAPWVGLRLAEGRTARGSVGHLDAAPPLPAASVATAVPVTRSPLPPDRERKNAAGRGWMVVGMAGSLAAVGLAVVAVGSAVGVGWWVWQASERSAAAVALPSPPEDTDSLPTAASSDLGLERAASPPEAATPEVPLPAGAGDVQARSADLAAPQTPVRRPAARSSPEAEAGRSTPEAPSVIAAAPQAPVDAPAAVSAPEAAFAAPVPAPLVAVGLEPGGADVVAHLTRGEATTSLPASVPAGNYDLTYRIGDAEVVSLGTVKLVEGEARVLRCGRMIGNCALR